MIIVGIRTDNPEAEVVIYDGNKKLSEHKWTAHRQLAETLHATIRDQLVKQHHDWDSIEGVVAYKGPGSFTGLRIGLTVANTIASSYQKPIVGMAGDLWMEDGVAQLMGGQNDTLVMPEYGADARITLPKT